MQGPSIEGPFSVASSALPCYNPFMPEEHNTKTKTGPTAILEALRGLDLDKLEAEAREGLKTGSKTSRGRYTKALNAIRGLKRTGVEPHELMVTSIPVIPPKFRPFAQQGDTLIPGDANTLYKDFIEQNDAFREELGMFGSENAGRGRLDLYDAAKALYGYGDPTKEKSRQKDVRGFLKKLTGRTSKTGYFQSKLVAKPMDSVGRSTIIVNPELSMDEIGIPVDMALTMYAPHIQRRLRQSGMPDSDALKAVRDRTPAAVRALEEEVKTRPVVYSRAPAWWKHNVLSGKVRLTEGDAISISPATTTPLNADFDGDQQINCVFIALDFEAIKAILPDFYKKYKDCALQALNPTVACSQADAANADMYKQIKTVMGDNASVVAIDLEDFPHTTLANVRKDDKYDIEFYNVPEGIRVPAYDESTGRLVWAPVSHWSIHRGKAVEIVNLDDGSQIYTDDDPRAVYGVANDAETLVPQRFTPTEAAKRGVLVPQDKKSLQFLAGASERYFNFETSELQDTVEGRLTVPVDFELGQLIGIMAGDGWCDKHPSGTFHVADTERFNARFVLDYIERHNLIENPYITEHEFKAGNHGRYGRSIRHSFNGKGRCTVCRALHALVGGDGDALTYGAGNKRFPVWYPVAGRSFLAGLVNGLIATDGSVSFSTKKGRTHDELLLSVTSISLRLLRETKAVLGLLGIKSTISFSKETVAGNVSWILTICTPDAKREGLLDRCCHERKASAFRSGVVSDSPTALRNDHLPLPKCVHKVVLEGTKCYCKDKAVLEKLDEAERSYRLSVTDAVVAFYKDIKQGFITRFRQGRMLEILKMEDTRRDAARARGLECARSVYESGALLTKEQAGVVYAAIYAMYSNADTKNPERLSLARKVMLRIGKKINDDLANVLFDKLAGKAYAYATLPIIRQWAAMAAGCEWRHIVSVEKAGEVETGYDLTVPGYETFTSVDGIVLSNTINVHVPATDEAVKEAFDVLMPSASPYIDRTGDAVVTKLKQEQVLGMHNSALRPSAGTYRFKNEQEALAAVKRGDVPLEADLEIDGFNPKPGMLPKEAGKMMEVAFKNLEQSGEVGERRTKGIVYMPDCEEYRGIIAGDDRKAKAELVQKFVLNQAPGVVYAACDAYVVEE